MVAVVTATAPATIPPLRSGPVNWLRSYAVMTRWLLASLRLYLPLLTAVEILAGVGFVLGFGLFFPGRPPAESVLYVSTGVPVITLYIVGMVFLPQIVGQEKIAKSYDFSQSQPVPRSAGFTAWLSMNLMTGVPGMVAALVAAGLRFDTPFRISVAVIPATLLICLTSTAIGYAMGHAIPLPMITNVITQVLIFFGIGFAPICFPASQLPGWLATLNRGLPFGPMATVMRAALLGNSVTGVPNAYAVLGAWSAICLLIAAAAVTRRA